MRTRDDWQIIEVFVKTVMKRLLILTALFAVTASATIGSYKLILVTQADHFEPQMGTFATLRGCTTDGARLLHDQNIYAGFGCVFWEGKNRDPENVSEYAPLVPPTIRANAQENPSDKHVEQAPEPYVLTLYPQFLEGVDAFDTREACVERGMEFLATTDIFNGFVCEHGRAWQKDE